MKHLIVGAGKGKKANPVGVTEGPVTVGVAKALGDIAQGKKCRGYGKVFDITTDPFVKA